MKESPMPTRNVVLTDHHEQVIEDLVRSGKYQNASEVLREGVRLIELREQHNQAKLSALRDAIQQGFDAEQNGEFTDFASFDEMETHLRRIADAALAPKIAKQAS
jgi:antitoxin ParD1/3/4